MLISVIVTANASSYQLNEDDDDARFFTEWNYKGNYNVATLAGIKRTTEIYVYLFAGETCYFGSSVAKSNFNQKGTRIGSGNDYTGNDIVVIDPSGAYQSYDVLESGEGYINTRAKEKAGPAITYTENGVKVDHTADGYTPFSFTAKTEGRYIFHFYPVTTAQNSSNKEYAVTGDEDGVISNESIGKYNATAVAAWDITVVDKNNKVKRGRTFTNYLSLTTGGTKTPASLTVYALTDDGFIYKVDLKDLVPYGFIFFANNMGLTTTGLTPSSIYHSVYDSSNNIDYLSSCEKVTYHSPNAVDTDGLKTYKLFFEEPSEDLEGIFYNTAVSPAKISDVSFTGINDSTSAYYSQGGRFTFTTSNASSVSLRIDFSDLIKDAKSAKNVTKAVQEYTGNGIVEINGAVTDGQNTFYWDGKDTSGQYIPVGVYDGDRVTITATPKSGEIHFPLLDVEGFTGGITVERMNDIYNSDGSVYEVAEGKYDLYYNNNPLVYGTIEGSTGTIVRCDADGTLNSNGQYCLLSDGTLSYYKDYSRYFKTGSENADTISTLKYDSTQDNYYQEAVDSSKTTMYFDVSNNDKGGGDTAAIDAWTYYTGESTSTTLDLNMEIIDEENYGAASGLVFYDEKTANGTFNPSEGDYRLSGVKVNLLNSSGDIVDSTTTDINGVYYFYGLEYGEYTVKTELTDQQKYLYTLSTKNDGNENATIQNSVTINAENDNCKFENIGYTSSAKNTSTYVVQKRWTGGATKSDSIIVEMYYSSDNNVDNGVLWDTVELTNNTNWTYTFRNLDSSKYYFVKEYYEEKNSDRVLVGVSKPIKDFSVDLNYTDYTTNDENSRYRATFRNAVNNGISYLVIDNSEYNYKVVFHSNAEGDSTNFNTNDIFRTYYANSDNTDSSFVLKDDLAIDEFYDIPDIGDDYIFAGWYYDADFDATDNSLRWNEDKFTGNQDNDNADGRYSMVDNVYHIYAHWIPVDSVSKTASGSYGTGGESAEEQNRTASNPYNTYDNKITGSSSYKGFDMVGVQVRDADTDPNFSDDYYTTYYPQKTGLRFITAVKEELLKTTNSLFDGKEYGSYTDKNLEYGNVVGKASSVNSELRYKSTNDNGEDTSNQNVTNLNCTSSVPISGTTTVLNSKTKILDHKNYKDYRIFSSVITYDSSTATEAEINSAKVSNVVARSYMRYTDANGLYRTYYNNYSGTNVYGGCSVSYTFAQNALNSLQGVIKG
jgi:hypothetical protein